MSSLADTITIILLLLIIIIITCNGCYCMFLNSVKHNTRIIDYTVHVHIVQMSVASKIPVISPGLIHVQLLGVLGGL